MEISLYKDLSREKKMSFWVIVSNLIQKGLSIIATPIFTRLLTTEEYAQSTLYDAWFSILLVFASLQIYDYTTMTGMTHFKKDYKCFVATGQITMIVCTAVVSVIVFFLNKSIDLIMFSQIVIVCLLIDMISFSAYNLWITKKQCLFDYKSIAAISILMGIMSFFLQLVFVVVMKERTYSKIFGLVISHVIIGSVLLVSNLQGIKINCSVKYIKYILSMALPIIPHLLASQVLMRSDRLMIGSICGNEFAGIYSVAYSLAMLTILVNDAILKAYIPWEYSKIKNGNTQCISIVTNRLIVAVAIINFMVMLFAPELIRFFAPEEYYKAIYIIPPVSASVFIMFIFNLYVNIEYYYGKTKFISIASIGAAVLNIVLNFIFIPKYGFVAAGYTTLVSYCFYTFGHYCFSNRTIVEKIGTERVYNNKVILSVSALLIFIAIIISILYNYILLRYAIVFISIIIVFLFKNNLIGIIKEML